MAVAAPRAPGRRRGRRRTAAGPRYPGWLALPAVGWYLLFFLGPLSIMAAYSFAAVSGYSDVVFDWNVENYRYLWDPLYIGIFRRTLELALIGTVATLAIGFPFAYYVARYAKRKTLLLLLVIVPFWTSFLIRTYAWLIILDPEFPPFRALRRIGFPESFELLYTEKAIYIGVVYNYLPLMILPLYAALERVDWSLVDAAQDLGDGPLRAFRRVTLPLVLPGVLAGSLLVFIPLMGEFLIPSILGGDKTLYAGNLIAQQFLEARDWPFGSAIAMVVVAGLTIALMLYARLISGRRCSTVGRRLLGAHVLLVFVVLYLPIVVVVALAFNGGKQVLYWEGFSTKWFGEALRDPTITEPLRHSLLIAAGNAVVACVLGTMLALALPRMRAWLRVPLDALAYMTLVTPEIVFGISALIFFVQAGLWLGIESPLGLWTILVAHVVFNATVVALVVRARFVGMSQTLEEASYDLGAGPLSTFRQVTLPRLAPAVLAGGLLAFTFSFDDFITSFFVAGAGSTTLPLRIFSSLRFGVSPAINATAAMMLALTLAAVVIAYIVLRRTASSAESPLVRPG